MKYLMLISFSLFSFLALAQEAKKEEIPSLKQTIQKLEGYDPEAKGAKLVSPPQDGVAKKVEPQITRTLPKAVKRTVKKKQ